MIEIVPVIDAVHGRVGSRRWMTIVREVDAPWWVVAVAVASRVAGRGPRPVGIRVVYGRKGARLVVIHI